MSFPTSHHAFGGTASGPRPALSGLPRSTTCRPLPAEGDHHLEKLEFALAIALTRGDAQRSRQLREEIDRLGGNREEPGT
jgi:hypothetical protein